MHVDELEQEAALARADEALRDDLDEYGEQDAAESDEFMTDDGISLPDEVQAELEALAATELDESDSALEAALAEAQREVSRQRNLTRQAVARYREAILVAEPDLPPDLVRGESLEEIEESVETERLAVARIRERVSAERHRAFPIGAPERSTLSQSLLSPQAKIAAGLQERLI